MNTNSMSRMPLVSIIIPNFNHSMYLDQSIQSALNQTYGNIEVIVNDNASTDCSVEVAKKYLDKGIVINKNPENVANSNYRLVYDRSRGEYFVLLCADDVLAEDFVEKAVAIMEEHRNVGLVHVERNYIDEAGRVTELDPFFRCSFLAGGESMLPIFMLTDVGQSAQGLIRRSAFEQAGCHDTEHDHTNIDKEQWFRLCMHADYAYVREIRNLIRKPVGESQTSTTVRSFYHPIALYVSLKGFVHWGRLRGYREVVEREEKGMKKLATECLQMAESLLAMGDFDTVRRYLLFMQIADPEIVDNEIYRQILEAWEKREIPVGYSEEYGETENFSFHKRNYEPPAGYQPFTEE